INGVTFTAKATPANPGEFDIGGSADATRAILANAINGAATGKNSASGYFEVSAADRKKLSRITAVNDDTANTLTITGVGTGRITVGETLTDGTDAWAGGKLHCFAGRKHSVDIVVQQDVKP